MFTGIITEIGIVKSRSDVAEGVAFTIDAPVTMQHVKIGDSVAINGVCHTVTKYAGESFTVVSMPETLSRTTMKSLEKNARINLELPLGKAGRLDGHIVQGHVDTIAQIIHVEESANQTVLTCRIGPEHTEFIVEKGSMAINGVSLTVTSVTNDSFGIALIPHTRESTTLGQLNKHDLVNIELDYMAKYARKWHGKDADIVTHAGESDASNLHIAIVLPRFNEHIGTSLLNNTLNTLSSQGIPDDQIDIVRVPGAFEIPVTARQLINHNVYDCIIALGVVIRGETTHYDQICETVSREIGRMSVDTGTPVIHGIVTAESAEQARARVDGSHSDKGKDAALAAIEMANLMRKLRTSERFMVLRTKGASREQIISSKE